MTDFLLLGPPFAEMFAQISLFNCAEIVDMLVMFLPYVAYTDVNAFFLFRGFLDGELEFIFSSITSYLLLTDTPWVSDTGCLWRIIVLILTVGLVVLVEFLSIRIFSL